MADEDDFESIIDDLRTAYENRMKEKRGIWNKASRRYKESPENKNKIRITSKKWQKNNKEKVREGVRKWQKNNKDKVSKSTRRRQLLKFGLTVDDYVKLKEDQNGVCFICKKTTPNKDLAVDHCHNTGKIRGLLCLKCNTRLGWFEKYADIILRYLK